MGNVLGVVVLVFSLGIAGCGYPRPADVPGDAPVEAWVQRAYIKASNPDADDGNGMFAEVIAPLALSADGSTLVMGAIGEDSAARTIDGDESDNTALDAGAAYVYVRDGATWKKQAYLKVSNAEAGDEFGFSIALSADGNTVVIGAARESGGNPADPNDNTRTRSGAAYIFVRTGTTWQQAAYLKANPIGSEDRFGSVVAVSATGDIVAISAPREDSASAMDPNDNSMLDAGAVYIFERTGPTWTQRAFIKAPNADAFDVFGQSMALSSNASTLAVGAVFEDSAATTIDGDGADDNAKDAGAAYVFKSSGVTTWTMIGYIKAHNAEVSDRLGTNLALSGDGSTLAVSSGGEDSAETGVGGSGTDNNASESGAVYVFSRTADTWTQQAYVKASNVAPNDFFSTVGLSADGNLLAVGAPYEDATATGGPADNSALDSGALYVFHRTGGTWREGAYLKAANAGPGDALETVAVAGTTIIARAGREDSGATLVNGDDTDNSKLNSGAVYVFELETQP